MSEPLASTTATESAPESTPEVEQARHGLERSAERSGVDLGAEEGGTPERPASGVRTPIEGAPVPSLDGEKVNVTLRQSLEARQRARYLSMLEKVAERAIQEGAATPPAAAPASVAVEPATNPYDRETDYWNWESWERQSLKDGILSSFDERLKPVLSFFEQQQEQSRIQAEEARRRSDEEAYYGEREAANRAAHDAYVATEEGRNYIERVSYLCGTPPDPGDPARGIPPRPAGDGVLTLAWEAAGFSPDFARHAATGHVRGIIELCERHNQRNPQSPINPAFALDRWTRTLIAGAASYLGMEPQYATGNAVAGYSAAPAETPAQRRAAAHRQVASSAVAGSVAQAGAEGGKDLKALLADMVTKDKLGVTEMRLLADRFFRHKTPMARMEALKSVLSDLGREQQRIASTS